MKKSESPSKFSGSFTCRHTPLTEDNYLMGRSVYTPMREAEEMRESINRKAMLNEVSQTQTPSSNYEYSYRYYRPTTPYDITSQSSRSVTPFDSEKQRKLHSMASSYYSQRSRPVHRFARNYVYSSSNQEPSPYGYLSHR